MKTFFKHLLIDYKIGFRDRTLLLMSYFFPLTFFLFMGFVMTDVNPLFKETLHQSMLIFSILVCTVLIVPNVVVSNRENGIYRSYKIYGISRLSIHLLIIISNLINVIVVSLIISLLSWLLFGVKMPKELMSYVYFYGAVFLVWFASINLAIFLGNIVKNSKHTVLYTQLLFLPSILLGGIMIPLETLKNPIQFVGKFIPSSHALNLINIWVFQKEQFIDTIISVVFLLILGFALFFLNLSLFKYDNKKN